MAAAVFAVSTALLAFEILLLRLFAVAHFHHFAYAVISIAMLGGGAAGTAFALLRTSIRGRERRLFPWAVAGFAAALVASPALARVLPFEPTALVWSAGPWIELLAISIVLAAPFFAGTAVVILAMLADPERAPRLYAANLVGSGAGALLALALLTVPPPWRPALSPYKPLPHIEAYAGASRSGERWGPLGWIVAVRAPAFHYAPGLSLAYRGPLPPQTALFVDGELTGAATLWRGDSAAAEFLDWLPAAAAYRVARPGRVLVLGAGAGLEVLDALTHGAERVVAVELDPNVVGLARAQLDSASDVYRDPRVRLEIGDARAFLERSRERFDLIVLSPGEAYGSAAAGLKALGEDYLTTVEALRAQLARLAPGGLLAVTRWVRAPPRDDVRMILTAGAALRASGEVAPGARLVCLRSWSASTLLVRPGGFRSAELPPLAAFARARLLDLDWLAGEPPPGAAFNFQERRAALEAARAVAAGAGSAKALARGYLFDVRPATDDRPYAGHFLRLGTLHRLLALGASVWLPFAEWGYVAVLATLAIGVLAGAIAMLVPAAVLARRGPRGGASLATVGAYFGAIGLGYLAVEMAFIQQLQRLLGHPVYAVSAAVAGFLAFSGLGSLWSARRAPSWKAPAAAGALVLLVLLVGPPLVGAAQALALPWRAAIGIATLAPLAVAMGFPFPTGLRALTPPDRPGLLAWAWGVNGFASVVAAGAATLVAVEWGWRWVLLGGTICYALAAALSYRPLQIFQRSTTSSPRTTS